MSVKHYTLGDKIKAAGPGRVLVHNHVKPAQKSGTRGFRAWEDDPSAKYVECSCGWHPEFGTRYRVAAIRSPSP